MSYTLQPYTTPASRYHCPECNHRSRSFVRYINTQSGNHLADHVGRCSREDKCGYHYKPRDYFRDNPAQSNGGWQPGKGFYPYKKPVNYAKRHTLPKPVDPPVTTEPELFINPVIVNASFTRYEHNNFVQYLIKRFGRQLTSQVIGRYRIGTSRHWPGATVFWQLDAAGRARTGKIMLYNAETGKRVKEPYNHIAWAHTALARKAENVGSPQGEDDASKGTDDLSRFTLKQCLFGEHQLTEEPNKPAAIVESEKTAIIASIYNPEVIWLATGGIGNLNAKLCQPLKNRHITLYPDLGAYEKWWLKSRQLQLYVPGSVFAVSDILETIAGDFETDAGFDLADCL